MTAPDDSPFEMDGHELDDEQIDALIDGARTPAGFEPVGDALASLRALGVQQPETPVGASLGEFVSTRPPAELPEEEFLLATHAPPSSGRKQGMLTGIAGGTLAKLAIAAAVAMAGITGLHAAGIADVPGLPDKGQPIEVVYANAVDPEAEAATDEDTAPSEEATDPAASAAEPGSVEPFGDVSLHFEDNKFVATVGDISLSIAIAMTNGEMTIDIEVEGVSPECEAALEALEDIRDPSALADKRESIEAACGDELAELIPGFGDLGHHLEGMSPDGFEQFFEGFDSDGMGKFFEEFKGGEFGGFFADELAPFLEDFGLEDFNLEDFNPEELEGMFEEHLAPFLEDLENFDLGEGGLFFEEFFGEDSPFQFEEPEPEDLGA